MSVGNVGNVIRLKFVQERFKVLSEKELVKNMMYLVWELNPQLSVHEVDTLQRLSVLEVDTLPLYQDFALNIHLVVFIKLSVLVDFIFNSTQA